MAVIGNKPAQSFNSIRKQTFTGTGDSAYSLDFPVSSPNDLEVFVNNVRQEPTVAYNAASQTLTMSEGIDSTDDFYAIYKAQAYGTTLLPVDQPITVTGATINGNASISGTASFAGGTISGNLSLDSGYILSAPTAGQFVQPGSTVQTVVLKNLSMVQHNTSNFIELSSNYRLSITPKYSTSKILLQASMCINPHCAVNTLFGWTLKRSTDNGTTFSFFSDESDGNTGSRWGINGGFTRRGNGHDTNDMNQITWQAWDSPATTGTVIYSPFFKQESSGTATIYVNHSSGNNNNWGFHTPMTIIAQEIKQ